MPRPKRKKLLFDEDSVNKLLQEIYDESYNIKAKLNRLFTKWEQKVKEGEDIAAIGDQIVKLIAAEAKNQEQKIMLLKYLKEVVFENKSGTSTNNTTKKRDDSDDSDISSNERNELLEFVQKEIEKRAKK